MSGPRNVIGDIDSCTQRVPAKFIAPILLAWLAHRGRDSAWDARTGPTVGERTDH